MNMLRNFLKGLIIGMGAIAPGVSGGAFAIMLGVYDKITDAIGNFYIDFKEKFLFLSTLGLGAVIGIVGFSQVLEFLFNDYEILTKYAFIGLILGSMPSVFKEANKKGQKCVYFLPLVMTLGITLMFTLMDKVPAPMGSGETLTFVEGLIYGGVIALGTIVPGISSSIILMYAGVYSAVLAAIGSLQWLLLLPLGLGFGITMLLLSKLINYLFKRFYSWTYYAVLGFVLGSITALIPRTNSAIDLFFGMLMCVIGFYCSRWMSNRRR